MFTVLVSCTILFIVAGIWGIVLDLSDSQATIVGYILAGLATVIIILLGYMMVSYV